MRVKQIGKDTIYVGTCNIMIMLKARKMNEIADEKLKTKLTRKLMKEKKSSMKIYKQSKTKFPNMI